VPGLDLRNVAGEGHLLGFARTAEIVQPMLDPTELPADDCQQTDPRGTPEVQVQRSGGRCLPEGATPRD